MEACRHKEEGDDDGPYKLVRGVVHRGEVVWIKEDWEGIRVDHRGDAVCGDGFE